MSYGSRVEITLRNKPTVVMDRALPPRGAHRGMHHFSTDAIRQLGHPSADQRTTIAMTIPETAMKQSSANVSDLFIVKPPATYVPFSDTSNKRI
jgi:hypothetical protein